MGLYSKMKISHIYNLNNNSLFFALFILSIVIDNINGYLQSVGIVTPIGVLFRGGILMLLSTKAFSKKSNWIQNYFFLLMVLYCIFSAYWISTSKFFSFGSEIEYLFRLIYFFVVVLFIYSRREQIDYDKVFKLVSNAGFIIGLLNIICFVTGIGVKSYGENYGFGTKAFYRAGNDLSIYMLMSIPIMIWYALKIKSKMRIFMAAITSIGGLLIGTRSIMIGVLLPWSLILVYVVLISDRYIKLKFSTRIIIGTLSFSVMGFIFYNIVSFIINFDTYTLARFTLDSAASPREYFINCGKEVYNNRDGLSFLIGEGHSSSMARVGALTGRDAKDIEADNHDMILNFGYGYGSLFILFYFLLYIKSFVVPLLRRINSLNFTIFITGTLWYGVALMAGHGFLNVMIIPLIALFVSIDDRNIRTYL